MKQLYLLLFTLFAACLFGCLEEPQMDTSLQNAFAPELEKFTRANVDITATTIVARATVKKENGDPVTERGFIYWLKNTTKVETVNETNLENGKGEFSQKIEKLQNDTIYYISPYARNKKGTTYGDTLDINTKPGIGSVITSEVTEVTATTAVVGGLIKDKGEGEIKMIGFNLYKNSELDSIIKIDMDEMPTDSTFIHTLTELESETDYVIEAIVENSFGQFNTDRQSFKTPDGHPELGFLSVIETDYTQVTVRAKLLKKGDGELDSIGFCWSDVKAVGRPNIKEDSTIKCTVDKDGFFVGVIPNLKAQTQYYVHSYAVNAFGTVYTPDSIDFTAKSDAPTIFMDEASNYVMKDGNVTVSAVLKDDGRGSVSEIVICYSLSATPNPDKDEKITLSREELELDADNRFKVSLPKLLKGNQKYYVIAYAKNKFGTGSSSVVSFTTPPIFSTTDIKSFPVDWGLRKEFAAFSLGNDAFILGGDFGSTRTKELIGYNADNNVWMQYRSYDKEATNISVCTNENTVYALGGRQSGFGQNGILRTCYSYSYSDNTWNEIDGGELVGENIRYDAVSFVSNDKIYLIGGVNLNSALTDTIFYYDMNAKTWSGSSRFDVAFSGGIALMKDGNAYVGLGNKPSECGFFTSSGDFKDWTSLETPPGLMNKVSTGVVYYDNIYVIDDSGIIWQYNLTEDKWYQRSTCLPEKIKNFKIYVLNDMIYILGMDYFNTTLMTYDPSWDN